MGPTFIYIQYPSIQSPNKHGIFSFICARPRDTSILNMLVVIGNVTIFVDISVIISIFIFAILIIVGSKNRSIIKPPPFMSPLAV